MLGLKGTVENLDDNRVKIMAEGNEDKLKWFEEAININDNLIQVSSIERETDSRLYTAASYLNNLIGAVNNLNDNLGRKIDVMIDLQRETLNAQENLLEEVQESRKDLKGYLEQRFEKLESDQINFCFLGLAQVFL